jgi:hypothetical protein
MMEKEQADRYQSASELLQDIDVLVNGGAFPQTVANNQLSPVQMSATPNFNTNQPQSDPALQPIAESPTAAAPGRASSGRLSLANSSSVGRLGGAGSTSFRSRRRSANRSTSVVDNYVKPICIGIAASLLCILTALGIYFTLRPAPKKHNNSQRVEAPRSTHNAPAPKTTNLPPPRTPGT